MPLRRVSIEVCSRLQTPLKGDTIWGHIACGVANHEGADGVRAFCELNPPFVISSAFPHGMLPNPLLPPDEKTKEFRTRKEYTDFKKSKKSKYIPSSVFLAETEIDAEEKCFMDSSSTHVSISRDSGSALDEMLFSADEMWPVKDDGVLMDLYIASALSDERVMELLSRAFEFGFGADASVGAGRIRIAGGITQIVPNPAVHNRYLALGPFSISSSAVSDLRASTFVRKGKIGGPLARDLSPYKKSVILYDEGATFCAGNGIEYIGSLLHGMHGSTNYDICHSAFAPVIEV